MNRLIQLITGLTLCLLLQACLSLPVKEAIPSWQIQGALAGFEDAIPKVKAKALEKLKEFGALNKVPASQIGKLSQHSDFEVRFSATQALHEKGTTEVIPYLIDRLKDEKSKIRCSATHALGELGAKEAMPHLMEKLKAGDQFTCVVEMAEALSKLGGKETVSQLLELLQSDEPLGSLNDTQIKSIVVSYFIETMLDDRSEEDRGIAMFSLRSLSNDTEMKSIVMSHLKKIISDKRDLIEKAMSLRATAMIPLEKQLGNDTETKSITMSFLTEWILDDLGLKATERAMRLLERISSVKLDEKEVASKLLTKWSQDVKLSGRKIAAIALGKMATPSLVSQLLTLLKSEDAQVRELTLEAFRNIETKAVAPQIMTLLKDERYSVRDVANYVLGKIGAKEVPPVNAVKVDVQKQEKKLLPQWIKQLKDKETPIREIAIEALGNSGEKAAIPPLVEELNAPGPSYTIRQKTVEALGKLNATEAIPQLITLLTDPSDEVRSTTINVLGKLDKVELKHFLLVMNVLVMNAISYASSEENNVNLRFLAHLVGGGDPKAEILLKWLGYPQANYPTALTHDQAVQILPVFKEALELAPPNLVIRNHLEKQMKIIMNEMSWQLDDFPLLQDTLRILNNPFVAK